MLKPFSISLMVLLVVSSAGLFQLGHAQAQPDFKISVSPTFQEVQAGQTTTFSVQVAALDGFSDSVELAVSGLPMGSSINPGGKIFGEFFPSTVPGSGVSTLKITTQSEAIQDWYTLTVIGESGSIQHNQRVRLAVDNPSLRIDLFKIDFILFQKVYAQDHSNLNVKIIPSADDWFEQSYVDDVKNAMDRWLNAINLYTGEFGDEYLGQITVCTFVEGLEANQCGNNFDVNISWVRIFTDLFGNPIREVGEWDFNNLQAFVPGCDVLPSAITLAAFVLNEQGNEAKLDDMGMTSVAAHEFGHFLGLGHATGEPNDLMSGEGGELPITTLDVTGLAVSWEWLREGTFKCPSTATAHLPDLPNLIPYEGMDIVIKIKPPNDPGFPVPQIGFPGDGFGFEMVSHYGGTVSFHIVSPDFKEMVSGGLLDVPHDSKVEFIFPTDFASKPNPPYSQPSTSSIGWYDVEFHIEAVISAIEWDNSFFSGFTIVPPSTEATTPTIQSAVNLTPNSDGWNNAPVTVLWSVSDPDSGISSSSGCDATILTSETPGTTLTCAATNGAGLSGSASVTVRIDMTPPAVTGRRSVGPNANGWNKDPVTVSFMCIDTLSGVDPTSITPPIPLASESAGQFVTGVCKDNAGNLAYITVGPINIDLSFPVVIGSRFPGPNGNGWNNHDVTVLFSCTDSPSGVDVAPLSPQVVSTEGAGQSRAGTCIDRAGNSASAIVGDINIDKTPPVVTSVQDGQFFILRQAVLANAQCTDPLSGIDTCIIPTGFIDTNTVGPHSYAVTSTDKAGNTAVLAVRYEVRYNFVAISPQPLVTRFQIGRTIPIRFQLTDALGSFVPVVTAQIWIDSQTNLGTSTGSANTGNYFRFDTSSNQYLFNFSTTGMTAGSHTVYITLDDGTVHTMAIGLTS
ncbi:MAG TPA: PxKF domain-containing protein [Candidatus Dormibacteraeota bacterium]|nr:PxKF domain-containing protein [Candidatus Dormibacteraeota bacterium]